MGLLFSKILILSCLTFNNGFFIKQTMNETKSFIY